MLMLPSLPANAGPTWAAVRETLGSRVDFVLRVRQATGFVSRQGGLRRRAPFAPREQPGRLQTTSRPPS